MRNQKQIWVTIILLSLILACCSSVVSGNDASNTDGWTMFHQGPDRNGYSGNSSLVGSCQLLWNFTSMQAITSSPAVSNGYVYVGAAEGAVYCLNSCNGQLVWYFQVKSEVASSPAVCNGYVYFGSFGGVVYGLNATNGRQIWNCSVGVSVESTLSSVYSSPVVVGGVVYIGSWDGSVYALNATSGAKLWSQSIGRSVESSPAVSGGVVYVASNFVVYALNASTGSEIWSQHTGSTSSSPCVHNGYVYIGSYDGYVCSLNSSTGAFVWKYQTQDAVLSSPAVAYGCVYIGSEDNNVYCLNASTGSKIWQSSTGYWVCSSPAVAGGEVFVGSEDFGIYCFNAFTGVREWSYATGNVVDSSPAIVNGTLYVGSDDNHLYAFNLNGSGAESLGLQANSFLPWTTVLFDVIAFAVVAVCVFFIGYFAYWKRQNRSQEIAGASNERFSWLSAHRDYVFVLLILAFSAIFFVNLGGSTLWVADEQVYSQWAFHMVKSGDYLTPWGNGALLLWIGKPPLNMWLMSLSYQFLGVNNFSARIPSALFGSLSLVLVFFLGRKLYNSYVGFLSALILGTFTTFYEFARRAMTDVPFVFFVMASVYFFVLSDKKEGANKYAALSGIFFGLALMTKQVEALVIPLIIFAYLLATKRSVRFLFTRRFTLLWGTALLIFAPWLIYMNASFGSQFWQTYFVFSVVSRTTTSIEGHTGSYAYYFSNFANNESIVYVILMPFAAGLCLFNAVVKRVKEDGLILLWMIIVLALFTFAQTKLYYYILPAFPAFAIAISSFLYQTAKRTWDSTVNLKKYLSRRN